MDLRADGWHLASDNLYNKIVRIILFHPNHPMRSVFYNGMTLKAEIDECQVEICANGDLLYFRGEYLNKIKENKRS